MRVILVRSILGGDAGTAGYAGNTLGWLSFCPVPFDVQLNSSRLRSKTSNCRLRFEDFEDFEYFEAVRGIGGNRERNHSGFREG